MTRSALCARRTCGITITSPSTSRRNKGPTPSPRLPKLPPRRTRRSRRTAFGLPQKYSSVCSVVNTLGRTCKRVGQRAASLVGKRDSIGVDVGDGQRPAHELVHERIDVVPFLDQALGGDFFAA